MVRQIMYYLWRSPEGIFYITDYNEQKNGLTNIDGRGFINVKYICCSFVKSDLWAAAEKIVLSENNS